MKGTSTMSQKIATRQRLENFLSHIEKYHIIILITYFCVLVGYQWPINGFLSGHLGYGGPHLYAGAINLDATSNFIVNSIGSDGKYFTYHHQPTLGFYIYNIISHLGTTYADKLYIGYLVSIIILCISWITVYYVLINIGINKTISAFIVTIFSTSTYFYDHRALLNFDQLTVLCISMLLWSFSTLEKIRQYKLNNIKKIIIPLLLIIICLNISWYIYPITALYFITSIIIRFRNKENWKEFFIYGSIIAISMCCIIGIMVYKNYYYLGTLSDLKLLFKRNAASADSVAQALYKPTYELVKLLLIRFKEVMPKLTVIACALPFLLYAFISNNDTKRFKNGNLLTIAFSFIVGGFTFILLTRYWSFIHPFCYPLMAVGFYIVFAIFLNKLNKKAMLIIPLLSIISVAISIKNVHKDFKNAKMHADSTYALIDLMDNEFNGEYAFDIDNAHNEKFNTGMLLFVTSYPHRRYVKDDKIWPSDKIVSVKCLDKKKGVLTFVTKDKSKSFIVEFGNKKYQRYNEETNNQ